MLAFVALLALAAPPAEPASVIQSRKTYSACLKAFVDKAIEERMAADAFASAFKAACQAEETAFRDAVIAHDTRTGLRRSEAADNAAMQIEQYRVDGEETFAFALEEAKGSD